MQGYMKARSVGNELQAVGEPGPAMHQLVDEPVQSKLACEWRVVRRFQLFEGECEILPRHVHHVECLQCADLLLPASAMPEFMRQLYPVEVSVQLIRGATFVS